MYTKQKCKGGLNGVCFELVNAAGLSEVYLTYLIFALDFIFVFYLLPLVCVSHWQPL